MKNLNISLILLVMMSAAPVYADCPPAGDINLVSGEYGATGMRGAWYVKDATHKSIDLNTIRTATFLGADCRGTDIIFSGGEDRTSSTCSMLVCGYKVNEVSFTMTAPAGQYTPKDIGTNWTRVTGVDTKAHNTALYSCGSANNNLKDCPFNMFP